MSRNKNVWLKFAGISGILAPLIAFTCIALAIASSPKFSWTENALSDLGAQEGLTAIAFNSGLILGGILALIFAFGLFIFMQGKLTGRISAFLFILDILALTAIGVLPESVEPMHYYASIVFFVLFPSSMFLFVVVFPANVHGKNGLVHISSSSCCSSRMDNTVFGEYCSKRGYPRSNFCPFSVNVVYCLRLQNV